jgi:hypothetical protein
MRAFQSAREKAANRPLPAVEPGDVTEGVFRSWLEGFLPMRYGVTSGYIISSGLPASAPMKHFDVIIYDRLEAPVLWRDNNPDRSNQGLHRPIPAEYVRAVLEVKSTFNRESVRDAMRKLHELDPLLAGTDGPDELYPRYLPKNFACGVVFFRVASNTRVRILDQLVAPGLRGWLGGVVLARAENELASHAGWIINVAGANPVEPWGADFSDNNIMSKSQENEGGGHRAAGVLFDPSSFAWFAFTLLGALSAKNRAGFLPSMHAMGFIMNPLTDDPGRG